MKIRVSSSGWRCRCNSNHGILPCRVPPSPAVMTDIFMEYRRSSQDKKMSFRQYLTHIGFVDPSVNNVGMDDGAQFVATPGGPQLLAIPAQPVVGKIQVKVLLVDFSDRPGFLPTSHYEDMLFSEGVYPTGSLRDYYKEVSLGKVDVTGAVHGWLRMPHPYSFYTNNESGTNWRSYPRNAPKLAEDAVKAALDAGIKFDRTLDKFSQGIVTALIIIHAGRGAEVMLRPQQGGEIWSHKWQLANPVEVAQNLSATIYLTVPHDCRVGVCAHELGHLAFQWQDFYDPNYDEDGTEWDGSGVWDLMAGGSYNGDSTRPAHPAPLHKLQHGWITASIIKSSGNLTINPYTATTGHVYKLVSPNFNSKQYLLLESRRRVGFDFDLPAEGLLVWKVDEDQEMYAPAAPGLPVAPGLSLVQADGRNDLESPDDWNQGDASDPFPGSENHVSLDDIGVASTSFPGSRSGISLDNINFGTDGVVTLRVRFANSPAATKPVTRAKPDAAAKKTSISKESSPVKVTRKKKGVKTKGEVKGNLKSTSG
jgi:immune inhibitor A